MQAGEPLLCAGAQGSIVSLSAYGSWASEIKGSCLMTVFDTQPQADWPTLDISLQKWLTDTCFIDKGLFNVP